MKSIGVNILMRDFINFAPKSIVRIPSTTIRPKKPDRELVRIRAQKIRTLEAPKKILLFWFLKNIEKTIENGRIKMRYEASQLG